MHSSNRTYPSTDYLTAPVGTDGWTRHVYSNSGCTSLAIVDLKEKEAQDAAAALVAESCGQLYANYFEIITEEFVQVNSDMKPEDFRIIGLECDVSSERSVQKAYQQVMDTFGRVDSVVASAGAAAHRYL